MKDFFENICIWIVEIDVWWLQSTIDGKRTSCLTAIICLIALCLLVGVGLCLVFWI